jgi:asparagine synthase (glutamine-hydrolysing)
MCVALEHRGPDARGEHLDDGIGLGIQRLRVIDLATGDQPIYNEDRSVAVVLNGEIYNYMELRAGLERSGHTFSTAGDTEVIAHLYEEEGDACVESLHGMFAFALWDVRRQLLLLARDRVGKKPLFYALRDGGITFASELNAVMADPEVPRDLDYNALDAYLALRWVPCPMSAYRAVRKLPPAHTLVLADGRARLARYWKLDFTRKRAFASEPDLVEQLRDQIRRAVRRRLIADVPLGAFLSGGVDSSAVVAAMAEASPTVRTFSIGFTSDDYDELPRARRIAGEYATDHHEFVVEPKAIEILPRIVRHYGEPFADASAVPSFYVAEMARSHVTVALNGDGGDEAFGGYTRYVSNLALSRFDAVPLPVRRMVAGMADRLPDHGRIDSWTSRIRRACMTTMLPAERRYTAYMSRLIGLPREGLYTEEFRSLIGESVVDDVLGAPWRDSSARHLLDRMLDVDTATYLPDDLLTKIDIATMAYSLEGRSPFLDHELMEFAASLPPSLKVRGTEKKVALRRALRGWVPDEILDGRKMGFRSPIADWFRGELRQYARDVLLDPSAIRRGYFHGPAVSRLLDRHESGAQDLSQAIWTLLIFELWHGHADRVSGPHLRDRVAL